MSVATMVSSNIIEEPARVVISFKTCPFTLFLRFAFAASFSCKVFVAKCALLPNTAPPLEVFDI